MSREQIGRLIAEVQSRLALPERLPTLPTESTTAPIRTRPPLPDWLPGDRVLALEPEDEITIEADDTSAEGVALPDFAYPTQFGEDVPSFDALAYYLPFHFYRRRWGIYLLASGVLEVARHVIGSNRVPYRDRWVIGFAARALFLHEFFHHAVEVACSRLEFPLPTAQRGNAHYNSYFVDPTAAEDEESLANAYVARSIRRQYGAIIPPTPLKRSYWNLREFMDRQPRPYANYRSYVRDVDFVGGRDLLVTQMYVPWLSNEPGSLLGASMYFANVTPAASEYPLYLVLDNGSSHLRVARPFPKEYDLQVYVHSNDHKPAHIHVRDLSRDTETHYLWPSLDPYHDDARLPRRKEDSLKAYVSKYSNAIGERITAVYGASL
jgi:hypothetical protein